MTTVEKITKLFDESGKSANSILKELDFSPTAFSEWKRGKAKPTTDALKKLADYFDVSVDYLLGRTENPSHEPAEIDENEIRFALYEGEKALLTESDEEEIKNFVRFVVDKRKKETNQ